MQWVLGISNLNGVNIQKFPWRSLPVSFIYSIIVYIGYIISWIYLSAEQLLSQVTKFTKYLRWLDIVITKIPFKNREQNRVTIFTRETD